MSAPNRTIGIVDDDAAVRSALSRLVRAHGFAACTFGSAEAFQAAAHLDTCLLIVDIDLPGASGLELVERMDLETRPLPVVLLTGSAGDDATWQAEARRVGALALLRKPVEADECWR